MQLYLVRHGQSVNNANVDHPSRRLPDPPLTSLGEQQAAHLADYLATARELDSASDTLAWRYGGYEALNYRLNRLITSPMHRALQTAAPIATRLQIPVAVWVELHERGGLFMKDSGHYRGHPGLSRDEVRELFPTFDLPTTLTRRGWWLGSLETEDSSRQRARAAADRLKAHAADDWRDDNVLLVSHAAFLDSLLKALTGTLDAHTDENPLYFFYNTALSRLDFWEDGRIAVRYLNRVLHLPLELIS